ncbi:hypothetical protein BJV78DRAFT_192771 [Lactifluus subvellereus]|nr:hypothetical protein BJV78DRAFT_192771 [Lactifluus subvellereus]
MCRRILLAWHAIFGLVSPIEGRVSLSSRRFLYRALPCQVLVSYCSTDLGRLKVAPHRHYCIYSAAVASLPSLSFVSSPTNDPQMV